MSDKPSIWNNVFTKINPTLTPKPKAERPKPEEEKKK